jgi:Mg2+ and Co2+ transporter CorA
VQSASTAQRIKQLKDEIKTIEEAIRKYRKIKHPGYPAQKAYEDRRIRLVEIQQEILALLRIR